MGTRFGATKECAWPQSFKDRIVEADERQTALLFRSLHNTARVFKNEVAREVEEIQLEKGQGTFVGVMCQAACALAFFAFSMPRILNF